MDKILKSVFATVKKIFIGILFIIISPLIIFGIIYVVVYYLWEKNMRLWRHDPKTELKLLVKTNAHKQYSIKSAEQYFKNLVNKIAKISDANAGDVQNDQNITRSIYSSAIYKNNTKLVLSFTVDKQGESYWSHYDSGDNTLVNTIEGKVVSSVNFVPDKINISIDIEQMGAWMCVAILRDDIKYNKSTKQLWGYIKEKDIWIVKYKDSIDSSYGLRSHYRDVRAHKMWFDIPKHNSK